MDTAQVGTNRAFPSFQKPTKTSHWGLTVSQAAFHTFINLFVLLSKSEEPDFVLLRTLFCPL